MKISLHSDRFSKRTRAFNESINHSPGIVVSTPTITLVTNLVGYWKGDNSTLDSQSNFDLTRWGQSYNAYYTGKLGKAFYLIDIADVLTKDTQDLRFSPRENDFCISAWSNLLTFNEQRAGIISNYDDITYGGWSINYKQTGDRNDLCVQLADRKSTNEIIYEIKGKLNVWNHVIVTRKKGTITVFFNGEKVITEQANEDLYVQAPSFVIGAAAGNYNDGWSGFFNGFIDEVAYWNRSLTDDEAKNIYNSGNGRLIKP